MSKSNATRVLVDGVVIVGSILLAFAIDAWWNGRQEQIRREGLMEDLRAELVANRERLAATLPLQQQRAERMTILLDELSPDANGLPADSILALQRSLQRNPTFDPAFGILNLLVESGDLTLLQDRELRAALAGLDAVAADYLFNQAAPTELRLQPEVVFQTGSIVRDFSRVDAADRLITDASPEVVTIAAKYFQFVVNLTDQLLIQQGQALLDEFDRIIGMIDAL